MGAHRNHLLIARGSAAETDSWLDLLRREGMIADDEELQLHNRCDQLIAMLTTKIRMLDSGDQQSGRSLKDIKESYDLLIEDRPPPPYTDVDYLH